jgi:hypothetical protein
MPSHCALVAVWLKRKTCSRQSSYYGARRASDEREIGQKEELQRLLSHANEYTAVQVVKIVQLLKHEDFFQNKVGARAGPKLVRDSDGKEVGGEEAGRARALPAWRDARLRSCF